MWSGLCFYSSAERRHNRVKNWTRNVNIFEKDFLIVPIIKNAHWYLAIVCYPYLSQPVYRDKVDEKDRSRTTDLANGNGGTPSSCRESSRPKRIRTKDGTEVGLDDESFDEAEPNDEDLSADLSTLIVEKDKVCHKL